MTIRTLSVSGVALAALLLIVANIAVGRFSWALAALLLGGTWLALGRGRPVVAGTGFAGLIILAALGTGASPLLWMVTAAVAALVAWDLDHFLAVTESGEQVYNRVTLERIHLRRLLAVAGAGVVLAIIAGSVDLRFGLVAALSLGLLSLFALRSVVRNLKR